MHISPPAILELQDFLALWRAQYPKFNAMIEVEPPV
jgi:hypothetical protein